jgi:putative transport protein
VETLLKSLAVHPVAALFVVVALGSALGSLRIAGLSLGASGVLFVGLAFGHFGLSLPPDLQELGIILFVYAIGLQAGPRFFNQFRRRGLVFAKIGLWVVGAGAVMTWAAARLLHLDPAMAVGMYAGALTSTPGLAAATDAARSPLVTLGYGVAYPFGVVGVVLFIQVLPRLLRINLATEEQRLKAVEADTEKLQRRQFRLSNPACIGRTLADLQLHRLSEVNVTRIYRQQRVLPARGDLMLQAGDILVAVGRREELDKLPVLFGEEVQGEEVFNTTDVVARDVVVSNADMVGRSLSQLQLPATYGVVVSRVFREELDFAPTGDYVLELGDSLRLTGSRPDCERFVQAVGQQEKRIHETSITALSWGIVLGVVLAYREFSLPGGAVFRLGLAGGPLLVSLVLAHYGRIGHLNIRTPRGAKYILQQLGLVLFLAGAGTTAGAGLGEVLSESGLTLLLAGAVITLASSAAGFAVSWWLYRLDLLTVLGAVSGAMTSTPALGAASTQTDRPEPVLAYTGVYPVALITITVVCQFLYFLM